MATCASRTCKNKIKRDSYSRDWCSRECRKEADLRRQAECNARRESRAGEVYIARRTMSDEPEVLGQPSAWRWK
jgi:hypothetical protein